VSYTDRYRKDKSNLPLTPSKRGNVATQKQRKSNPKTNKRRTKDEQKTNKRRTKDERKTNKKRR